MPVLQACDCRLLVHCYFQNKFLFGLQNEFKFTIICFGINNEYYHHCVVNCQGDGYSHLPSPPPIINVARRILYPTLIRWERGPGDTRADIIYTKTNISEFTVYLF